MYKQSNGLFRVPTGVQSQWLNDTVLIRLAWLNNTGRYCWLHGSWAGNPAPTNPIATRNSTNIILACHRHLQKRKEKIQNSRIKFKTLKFRNLPSAFIIELWQWKWAFRNLSFILNSWYSGNHFKWLTDNQGLCFSWTYEDSLPNSEDLD